MIVNINDLEFNNENLTKHIESLNPPRNFETIKTWRHVNDWLVNIDMNRINFQLLTKKFF
jgi:hypothetical protein